MKRYDVPRISFVNKMDRMGANPWRAVEGINKKLKIAAAAIQIPIGSEKEFEGVVDLVNMKTIRNDGQRGVVVKVGDTIPQGTFTYVPWTPELENHAACGLRTCLPLASISRCARSDRSPIAPRTSPRPCPSHDARAVPDVVNRRSRPHM